MSVGLSEFKRNILNGLEDVYTKYHNENEKLLIGTIVSSIIKLDEEYFMLCDGRVLDKTNPNYVDLYNNIGDTYRNDANRAMEEHEFAIPNIKNRYLRMLDPSGKYDDEGRVLGDNKDWGLPENLRTDFDLSTQDRFIRNKQSSIDIDGNDGIDSIPLDTIGQGSNSNFKSANLRYVANGGGEPRIGDKIVFKSMIIYSYIYYKACQI